MSKHNRFNVMILVFILSGLLIFISACQEKATSSKRLSIDSGLISAYTSGMISRESPIKVVFTEDIVDSSKINLALDKSPFSFKPGIKGVAVWADSRTVEFRPEKRLPDGQDYQATLNLKNLVETVQGEELFTFTFSSMKQSFEINILGLQSVNEQKPELQQISGILVTADVDDDQGVEKILTANQQGKELSISWQHKPDSREHQFSIDGIVRGEDSSQVTLAWDGKYINVDKQGQSSYKVHSRSYFVIDSVRPVRAETEYIEIRFSDPLDKNQNLQGLVTVENREDLRLEIDRSILHIYSAAPWEGTNAVTVSPGIRNSLGYRLNISKTFDITFEELKPAVRFVGKGVILPTTQDLALPVEAVNLRAVIVEVSKIHEQNIPQFLQVNTLDGNNELHRVAQTVWKKTIALNVTPDKQNRWMRYALDLKPLLAQTPGGIYRIKLSFKRQHILYDCGEGLTSTTPMVSEESNTADDESEDEEQEYWEDDDYEGGGYYDYYQQRLNPCHPAYYREYYDHNINVYRNVLISDIGLLARQGLDQKLFVVATDIKSAQALSGAEIEVLDYQQQSIGKATTANDGSVMFELERVPFLIIARNAGQTGYLKLDDGSALPISHFDVGGENVRAGIKGFLYGERGVWRPGDPIYLSFILYDPEKLIPESHPVICEFYNPRGQLIKTVRRLKSLNGFYDLKLSTDPDALTGNWVAKVKVGGVTFEKVLRVETIMPNRLKIDLDFGKGVTSLIAGAVEAKLSAQWLHGTPAKNLRADVELGLTSSGTSFPGLEGFAFDDPLYKFEPENRMIFEGQLDANGSVAMKANAETERTAPGVLQASFRTRVFEPGGAFSTDRFSIPLHTFQQYIGIKSPRGDQRRHGMLVTDSVYTAQLVAVDRKGNAVPRTNVEIKMYRINWRWWWEHGSENIADYIGTSHYKVIYEDTVQVSGGKGSWKFSIKYPDWGRFLIRARDLNGGHVTGTIVYIDWPGWGGRGDREAPGGAAVLSFATDKPEYRVGEKVMVTIPVASSGRGLVSIESGSKVLSTHWIEGSAKPVRFEFTAAPEMAPNVYVHITFMQPHLHLANDLPIRMYGVVPVKIFNPDSRLEPKIQTTDIFRPEHKEVIKVSEANGRPMTYTLALVDEGLLGITRFQTPDPWTNFYAREALGVKTWDLFDQITGAYGARLEQLLAIGGGEFEKEEGQKRAERFPPMVKFLGPFELKGRETRAHDIDIPQYVGAVRLMIVAGENGAFGSAEKEVKVRNPLMLLGTLPRVLGLDESCDLPITVFALEENIKNVTVKVNTEGPLTLADSPEKKINFSSPGDQVVIFKIKAKAQEGVARVSMEAIGNSESSRQTIELQIRSSSFAITDVVSKTLDGGQAWSQQITLPGMSGTNKVTLEVSRIPPMNLGKRLWFLIQYPHGCVEQVTSAVFPQLYLNRLLDLSPERQTEVEKNVKAGIERLRLFQSSDGGFTYWPGGWDGADDWASNYAGHFLIEAKRAGYLVPQGLLDQWQKYQTKKAQGYVTGPFRSDLVQSYRLYTLALAGKAELGAMNRLREQGNLGNEARWRLAAAYQLAGQPEAAAALAAKGIFKFPFFREFSFTFGSDLRDKAMVVEALCLLKQNDRAEPMVKDIAAELSSGKWYSTQTTAYSLIALATYSGLVSGDTKWGFSYEWNGNARTAVETNSPVHQLILTAGEKTQIPFSIENKGQGTIYPSLIMEGLPLVGQEKSGQNGMTIEVNYLTLGGETFDPVRVEQGTDFEVEIKTRNSGTEGRYDELALTAIFPPGWEIRNTRLDPTRQGKNSGYDYMDIRDDRIMTYYNLNMSEQRAFRFQLHAAYLGRYYLPMINVEPMYDASIYARKAGQWIEVIEPGQ
jgi:uncharacterized protein YfaS (alpha-2-macroglobulin family)